MNELILTLSNMAEFVNENNDVVKRVLEKEMDEQAGGEAASQLKRDKDFFEPDHLRNMSKLKREVTKVIEKQSQREDEYNEKFA